MRDINEPRPGKPGEQEQNDYQRESGQQPDRNLEQTGWEEEQEDELEDETSYDFGNGSDGGAAGDGAEG